MAASVKILFVMELGLGPGDFVLDGNLVPLPKKGAEPPPQFSAHFYCGHTARCIKMPLGIGLSPGDAVLDREPFVGLHPTKGVEPLPNFRPISIVAKGWMHQDAT